MGTSLETPKEGPAAPIAPRSQEKQGPIGKSISTIHQLFYTEAQQVLTILTGAMSWSSFQPSLYLKQQEQSWVTSNLDSYIGAPMSWRAVLGGTVDTDTSAAALKAEEASSETQGVEPAGPGRGKARGRGRREQAGRDDRQEAGKFCIYSWRKLEAQRKFSLDQQA